MSKINKIINEVLGVKSYSVGFYKKDHFEPEIKITKDEFFNLYDRYENELSDFVVEDGNKIFGLSGSYFPVFITVGTFGKNETQLIINFM